MNNLVCPESRTSRWILASAGTLRGVILTRLFWYAVSMGLLSKLFGRNAPASGPAGAPDGVQPPEHAVLLKIVYDAGGEGLPDNATTESLHALQDRLFKAILNASAGELDGDEFGDGTCTIYCYGPNADRLWEAVAPVLETEHFPQGSVAIKRYGPPGAREENVDLARSE